MTTTRHTRRRLCCPDCAAASEGVIDHEPTCPALHRIERVCGIDDMWFRLHPGSGWRWRDVDPAELAEVEMVGLRPPGDAFCRVLVLGDGGGHHRRVIVCNGIAVLIVQDIPPRRGWSA